MKVCTDACLFGAWTAEKMKDKFPVGTGKPGQATGSTILDIGTGTGLLSLMLAQQLQGSIDAVELEQQACLQATENVAASKWGHRISVHHQDILEFNGRQKYDLVISNPPFFENALKSVYALKNLAKHEAALELSALCRHAAELTKESGNFALLLPAERTVPAIQYAGESGFCLLHKAMVRQTEKHPYFRVMLLFSRENGPASEEEILIRREGNYTERFSSLLRPYYLLL